MQHHVNTFFTISSTCCIYVSVAIFCLNSREAMLLSSAEKSAIAPSATKMKLYLYSIAMIVLMFLNNCRHILLNYILASLHQRLQDYFFVYGLFSNVMSKWSTLFKYYFFISIIWIISCLCCNWFNPFNKYIWITLQSHKL